MQPETPKDHAVNMGEETPPPARRVLENDPQVGRVVPPAVFLATTVGKPTDSTTDSTTSSVINSNASSAASASMREARESNSTGTALNEEAVMPVRQISDTPQRSAEASISVQVSRPVSRSTIFSLAEVLCEDDSDLFFQAKSACLPEKVRVEYTRKVWLLLAGQMSTVFVLAVMVHIVIPEQEEITSMMGSSWTGIFYGSAFALITTLLMLYRFRMRHPWNHLLLASFILEEAVFFGLFKWWVLDLMPLHFLGSVAGSLCISAAFHCSGLTVSLGKKLQSKFPKFVTEEDEKDWENISTATETSYPDVDVSRFPPAVQVKRLPNSKHNGIYFRMPCGSRGRPSYIMTMSEDHSTKRMYLYWSQHWRISAEFGSSQCCYFVKDHPFRPLPVGLDYPHKWQSYNKHTEQWSEQPMLMMDVADIHCVRGRLLPTRLQKLWKQNDGLLKATLLLGMLSWVMAAAMDLVLTKTALSRETSMASTGLALLLSFFFSLFFHLQVERQLRRCKVDRFMDVIVCINAELLLVLMIACCLVMWSIGKVDSADAVDAAAEAGVANVEAGGGGVVVRAGLEAQDNEERDHT